MANQLPYFKFSVADWLTGDIVYEDFNIQGLFINICAIYWQRSGVLSIGDINKRFKNPKELDQLSGRFFSVSDGFISIKFLDEQFEQRKTLSFVNSKNGKKGGRPKALKTLGEKPNANRTLTEPKAKESNIEKKREEKNNNLNMEYGNPVLISLKEFYEEMYQHQTWAESCCRVLNCKKDRHIALFVEFKDLQKAADPDMLEKRTKKDWASHYVNWAKKQDLTSNSLQFTI